MLRKVTNKKGESKIMDGIGKSFYYTIEGNASTAVVDAKAFIEMDGKFGTKGSKTNWKNQGPRFPVDQIFNVQKVGFIYKLSTGAAVTSAILSKLTLGNFQLSISDREIAGGSLAEFFDSAVTVFTGTSQPQPVRAFQPLLIDGGEWIEDENFDFNVNLPILEANAELVVVMKGILYKPQQIA